MSSHPIPASGISNNMVWYDPQNITHIRKARIFKREHKHVDLAHVFKYK